MKVYVNEVTGIADAITSMFMSKRTWTRELEDEIRMVCRFVNYEGGFSIPQEDVDKMDEWTRNRYDSFMVKYNDWIGKLVRWVPQHITLGRFIDFSITVEGLHRGGQDDWDAHAKRFDNRIIRSSTRMADFSYEMSSFYEGKIIPTDIALATIGLETPNEIEVDGVKYVKAVNGYIREDLKNNKDAKRGLYMLSIPSNFIFKINLTEWAHVYKERNEKGRANPEVKQCCETIADELQKMQSWLTRDLFLDIKN